MLGMQDEAEKGFHPYKFMDILYVGNVISETFFNLDNMSETERKKFKAWYAEKQKYIYCFQQELFKYCSNDIDVLRICLLKINSIFKNATGIEFLFDKQITTLSSMLLIIFLQSFGKKDMLPITPLSGYRNVSRNNKPQSQVTMLWLNDLSKSIPDFRWKNHPKGEMKIGCFSIDNYDPIKKIAYEFNGCFYHGCNICFKP